VEPFNVLLPLNNWNALGSSTEISSGQFQFNDPLATNGRQRFYGVNGLAFYGMLAIWQLGNERQFHLLQCRFNASQTISANQNFMLCKDQPKTLFLFLALEFGESNSSWGSNNECPGETSTRRHSAFGSVV